MDDSVARFHPGPALRMQDPASSAYNRLRRHPPTTTIDDDGESKRGSTWHRMKWTDDMVRALLAAVSLAGDDAGAPPKGKWKAVSRLMSERWAHVSPQQCEDKFNDLNKRYKRLNDILGRGTTCEVVQNPALLDSMHHIAPKAREEAKRIIASKQLFYQEICAFHNAPPKILKSNVSEEDDDAYEDSDEQTDDELWKRVCDGLWAEIDGLKSHPEKLEWIRALTIQLEEERRAIEAERLALEMHKFKWHKYRCNKSWDMEKKRLENERLMLENERAVMLVRLKELELAHRRRGGSMGSAGFLNDIAR